MTPLGSYAGGGRLSGSGVAAIKADAASETHPDVGRGWVLGGAAVGTLRHDLTISSEQFGGGAGVTSIGRHGYFVSLTGSSGRSRLGPILALNASDVTLGCGRSRCGQLVVIARAFGGVNNERNQRARR